MIIDHKNINNKKKINVVCWLECRVGRCSVGELMEQGYDGWLVEQSSAKQNTMYSLLEPTTFQYQLYHLCQFYYFLSNFP